MQARGVPLVQAGEVRLWCRRGEYASGAGAGREERHRDEQTRIYPTLAPDDGVTLRKKCAPGAGARRGVTQRRADKDLSNTCPRRWCHSEREVRPWCGREKRE